MTTNYFSNTFTCFRTEILNRISRIWNGSANQSTARFWDWLHLGYLCPKLFRLCSVKPVFHWTQCGNHWSSSLKSSSMSTYFEFISDIERNKFERSFWGYNSILFTRQYAIIYARNIVHHTVMLRTACSILNIWDSAVITNVHFHSNVRFIPSPTCSQIPSMVCGRITDHWSHVYI
jgi:hypothetical protein